MTSETTRMAEAELSAEVDRRRHENKVLYAMFDRSRHQIADAAGMTRGYGWNSLADEIRQMKADLDMARAQLEQSIEVRWLTREQRIEVALRQHLAGATAVKS